MEESLRRADAELTDQFKRTPAFPMNKSYNTVIIRPFEYDAIAVATLLSTNALPTKYPRRCYATKQKLSYPLLSTPSPDAMILRSPN